MALSDELEKISSERYALVKIIPSLSLNDSLIVKSGTIYEATLSQRYEVSSIKVDGVAYTESSTQNPSSTEYYYDISTGTFEINFGAAIGTKEAVLFYILRFTDSDYSVFDENGIKNSISSYHWESRLVKSPEYEINIKNHLVGIPTISSTSFQIVNNDNFLVSYMSGDNSFYNKEVFITLIINETVFSKYEGRIKSLNPSGSNISFTVYDTTSNLNNDCLMGDNSDEAYYNVGNYTTLDKRADGNIIPFVIGRSAYAWEQDEDLTGGYSNHYKPDESKTAQATCLDTSTSRTWGLCRSGGQGHKITDYGDADTHGVMYTETTASVDYGTGTNNRRGFVLEISEGTHNIELWDTIEMVKSGTTYQGIVTSIVPLGGGGSQDSIEGIMESGAVGGTYDNVNPNPNDSVGLVVVQGSNVYYMDAVNDYFFDQETLTNGNIFYKVEFNSGFESNHAGMTTLNYLTDKVYYRFTEDTATTDETTHGYAVRRLLEASGTTVASGSIPPEGNPTGSNVSMMIPKIGQTSVKNFAHYLGKILTSTFGYIYQDNSSLETKYRLFEAPAASNIVLENEIFGLKISFDGNDMAKDIRIVNDNTYYFYTDFNEQVNEKSASSYISSNKSIYHHGLINSKTQESVLVKTNVRESEKKAFIENEQMIVMFSTGMKYANLNIGDDISLQDSRIPGAKTTVGGIEVTPFKIIGIKNSSDQITFTCIDFKGL
jgi:hypothetical protein